jgi:hypothetical protein
MAKRVHYLVYDPTGATLLGTWRDAPLPSFRVGVDGIDALTVTLPRPFGALDESGEIGSLGTLRDGNRVEIWVADADTQPIAIALGAVGFFRVGVSAIGRSAGLSTMIWAGTITRWSPTPPVGVEVEMAPLAQILQGSVIVGAYTRTADPLVIARDIVARYCPGLTWDAGNPATAGPGQSVTVAFQNTTVADALAALRDLAGPDWMLYVTARGTVRLFAPDTSRVDWDLSRVADGAKLTKDALGRAKQVVVVYAGGQTVTAKAADWIATNPRAVFVQATYLTSAADALRLAGLKLTELDRVTLRGEVTVADGVLDLEALAPGQTVRLHISRPTEGVGLFMVGLARIGYAAIQVSSYLTNEQPVVIAAVTYDGATARLELSTPAPSVTTAIARLTRDLQNHLAKG